MEKEIPLNEKYRPRSWDEIPGKENKKMAARLEKILQEGKVHNFLIIGPPGMFGTEELIKDQLGCSDIDFIKVAASNDKGIETARQIVCDCHFSPLDGKSRVVLYEGAHRISRSAAEALLEVTENPPIGTYFVFTTPYPEKMPGALRNLCATFGQG